MWAKYCGRPPVRLRVMVRSEYEYQARTGLLRVRVSILSRQRGTQSGGEVKKTGLGDEERASIYEWSAYRRGGYTEEEEWRAESRGFEACNFDSPDRQRVLAAGSKQSRVRWNEHYS